MCEWCGKHDEKEMYCCDRYKQEDYGDDHPCFLALFNDGQGLYCVTKGNIYIFASQNYKTSDRDRFK